MLLRPLLYIDVYGSLPRRGGSAPIAPHELAELKLATKPNYAAPEQFPLVPHQLMPVAVFGFTENSARYLPGKRLRAGVKEVLDFRVIYLSGILTCVHQTSDLVGRPVGGGDLAAGIFYQYLKYLILVVARQHIW